MNTIDILGPDFIKKHQWLLDTAKSCEVALCGGCAAAINKAKTDYQPTDIDMVTTKANALRFIDALNHFLLNRSVHYRLFVNIRNSFVPEPATSHYRIQVPFWLPVCLFIIPHDQFRFYRIRDGYLLQLPQDVKKAAEVLTLKDGKPRIASEVDDWDFDFSTETQDEVPNIGDAEDEPHVIRSWLPDPQALSTLKKYPETP